jgi:hypothetical protein
MEAEERERIRRMLLRGPLVFRVARGCRSGCGCLATFISLAVVAVVVLALVFLFSGGGDSAGKRACERFYELGATPGGLALSEVGLGSELNDIREIATLAERGIRDASDALFAVAQPVDVDTVALVAATAAMGAACAEAGHSP